jgi:hypothetical protein
MFPGFGTNGRWRGLTVRCRSRRNNDVMVTTFHPATRLVATRAAARSAARAGAGRQRARGEGNGQRQTDARIVQIDVE